METKNFNLEGINLNAKCIGGKTLEEYLDGKTLEEALNEQIDFFDGAIEEGIADSLIDDNHCAPEWFKAQIQNIDILLPNQEIRDYVIDMISPLHVYEIA